MSSELRCVALGMALLAAAGCADFSRGAPAAAEPDGAAADGGTDTIATGDTAAVSFARDVYPLLVDGCQRCHVAGGTAGDTQLVLTGDAAADLATVLDFVNTEQPAGSRLLSKGSGTGHGGGTVYAVASPEYETILRWITQGAMP